MHIDDYNRFEKFRRNLRLLRTNLGMNVEYLAKEIGIEKYNKIYRLESGSSIPTDEELFLISDYFKIPSYNLVYKSAKIIFE